MSCPMCNKRCGIKEFSGKPRPTFMNVDEILCCSQNCYNLFKQRYERKIIKDIKCYTCNKIFTLNLDDPVYLATYQLGWRNGLNNYDYCCSNECYETFKKKGVCNRCGDGGKLTFVEELGYSLCNEYEYDMPCYDRYLLEKEICDHNNNLDYVIEIIDTIDDILHNRYGMEGTNMAIVNIENTENTVYMLYIKKNEKTENIDSDNLVKIIFSLLNESNEPIYFKKTIDDHLFYFFNVQDDTNNIDNIINLVDTISSLYN